MPTFKIKMSEGEHRKLGYFFRQHELDNLKEHQYKEMADLVEHICSRKVEEK